MGDRMREMKGTVKKAAGRATGNERMEAEGEGERTSARASREVKGAANKVKGAVKQGVGRATGNVGTQTRGKADTAKGNLQRTG